MPPFFELDQETKKPTSILGPNVVQQSGWYEVPHFRKRYPVIAFGSKATSIRCSERFDPSNKRTW